MKEGEKIKHKTIDIESGQRTERVGASHLTLEQKKTNVTI